MWASPNKKLVLISIKIKIILFFLNISFKMLMYRLFSKKILPYSRTAVVCFSESAIDWEYVSNPSNYNEISTNIVLRKAPIDVKKVLRQLHSLHSSRSDDEKRCLREELTSKLYWFPNFTHPHVLKNKSEEPMLLEKVGTKTQFSYFPATFDSLTKRLNLLRRKNLGHMSGNKSYFLKNDLALLEQALIRYSVSELLNKGFQLLSVPDILPKETIEKCGMQTNGKHSQVYHIRDEWAPNMCLSGTAEMALASYMSGKTINMKDLPLKLCAVSRCYRAEANKHQKERGIFRVHYFTKVEMFGVTTNDSCEESERLLDEFISIQRELFSDLGLHFKILEMPPCELGLSAFHKIDMETWLPNQKIYGEISSASNCTDYQSRRLNIKYCSENGESQFCHTVNGTACAIPRLLIAILENYQNLNGSIDIPIPLRQFMQKSVISDKFKEIILCKKPIP